MVTEYGMSDVLGPAAARRRPKTSCSSARTCGHEANYSEAVAATVDGEVARLLDDAHTEAATLARRAPRPSLDRAGRPPRSSVETLDEDELVALRGADTTEASRVTDDRNRPST